jgi:hypothetical protein
MAILANDHILASALELEQLQNHVFFVHAPDLERLVPGRTVGSRNQLRDAVVGLVSRDHDGWGQKGESKGKKRFPELTLSRHRRQI